MDSATKAEAKAKLDTLYVGIGYPETWRDYSSYDVKADDIQDTIFGTRRTDGQGVDPLLARMAQANAIRQAHGFRVPVDKGER